MGNRTSLSSPISRRDRTCGNGAHRPHGVAALLINNRTINVRNDFAYTCIRAMCRGIGGARSMPPSVQPKSWAQAISRRFILVATGESSHRKVFSRAAARVFEWRNRRFYGYDAVRRAAMAGRWKFSPARRAGRRDKTVNHRLILPQQRPAVPTPVNAR